jgi:hypothetical protein
MFILILNDFEHILQKSVMIFELGLHFEVNLLQNLKTRGDHIAVLESLKGSFSSLFEVTSCDWYFSDYDLPQSTDILML